MVFEALVLGHSTSNHSAGFRVQGMVHRDGLSMSGAYQVDLIGISTSDWDVQPTFASEALSIEVQGDEETIRWVAHVWTAEIKW